MDVPLRVGFFHVGRRGHARRRVAVLTDAPRAVVGGLWQEGSHLEVVHGEEGRRCRCLGEKMTVIPTRKGGGHRAHCHRDAVGTFGRPPVG